MIKKILIVTDSDYWAYDSIANNLIKFNSSQNLQIDKIHMRNNRENVFKKIKSHNYDLVFPMAYQIFNNQQSLISRILKKKYFKFKNLDYSKFLTGIHSTHSYDNFNSTPENTIEPPDDLINFLNNFKSINAVSKRLTKLFSNKFKGKIYYTPNGVDDEYYIPKKKPYNQKLTLGFVGHVKRDKNLGYTKFIKEIMKENFLDIKCAIYGTNSYLTTDKLCDFYNSLDALIITSRSEGLPLRALEAMACGTPVISTKVSGCEDLIIEGKNGFFIDYDLNKILEKIRYLRANDFFNNTLRDNTRKIIEEEWTWKSTTKEWINFFDKNL